MSKKYAIYKNYFNNDYCYYDITSSNLYQVFDSLEKAKATLKQLKANAFRHNDYWVNYEYDNVRYVIQDFTFEKLGKKFDYIDENICNRLSEEDLYELSKLLQLELYSLVDVSEDKMHWAVWNNRENCYLLKFFDEESFLADNNNDIFIDSLNKNPPIGTLDDLSDSPNILKSLLNTQSTINYENNRLTIMKSWQEFNQQSLGELIKINAWLKNHWFEFREVGLIPLNELQKWSIQ